MQGNKNFDPEHKKQAIGVPGAIRTHNHFLRREVLYPVELQIQTGYILP